MTLPLKIIVFEQVRKSVTTDCPSAAARAVA